MKRVKSIKIIRFLILFISFLGLLSYFSYYFSKRTAEQFVGKTLQYFPLSRTKLLPFSYGTNDLVWWFTFSDEDPHTFDNEFEVYTTVLGKIVRTNPTDLGRRLRNFEQLEVHPYSPEAKEKFERQEMKKKQIAQEKGVILFDASSFKNSFNEYFTPSNIEAPENTSTHGVYFFPEPEWWATLSPKKSYSLPSTIEAIFPIIENNRIEASIIPNEIEYALERCLSHPYVTKYIKNIATTGIRLRITGDRLHWDTPELQKLLTELKGNGAEEKELRNWAQIIIDAEKNQYFSFYFNSISGELIYIDHSQKCSMPILVPGEPLETKQTNTL